MGLNFSFWFIIYHLGMNSDADLPQRAQTCVGQRKPAASRSRRFVKARYNLVTSTSVFSVGD